MFDASGTQAALEAQSTTIALNQSLETQVVQTQTALDEQSTTIALNQSLETQVVQMQAAQALEGNNLQLTQEALSTIVAEIALNQVNNQATDVPCNLQQLHL
ncbi:MAG: hypothetical protein Q9P01_16160 [Anaerolineae bacterium]|nr:hypothetical protein [Anaerolineae bacterium]